jgi:hypothetical protein
MFPKFSLFQDAQHTQNISSLVRRHAIRATPKLY